MQICYEKQNKIREPDAIKSSVDLFYDPVLCRRKWRSILACPDRKALPRLGPPTISIGKSKSDPKGVAFQHFRKNHAFVDTYFLAAYSFASS